MKRLVLKQTALTYSLILLLLLGFIQVVYGNELEEIQQAIIAKGAN